MILEKWRGYKVKVKTRNNFYCKLILFNERTNSFMYVNSTNKKGLSTIEIHNDIYKAIIKESKKYD